jgi:3',5'-cyclic AMP phosphodiesterase CpdA
MFVLAHLSDLHLSSSLRLADLAGKRGLGFINWHRGRKYVFRREALDAITRDVTDAAVDHIAVTGDLVNFSITAEYVRARAWLETLGPPSAVTVIPGNHDTYVPQARLWPGEFWGDYMQGDDAVASGTFPFLRRRGAVALIALSSALPTAPLLATGRLGDQQLARLAALLEQTSDLFRVVLIHHPPMSPPSRYLRRLTDGAEFRRVLAERGAELILHGHDHCFSLIWLDGPGRAIPAVGVPAASARAPHGSEDAAGYNLFRIVDEAGGFSCEMIARQRATDGGIRDVERRILLSPARPHAKAGAR